VSEIRTIGFDTSQIAHFLREGMNATNHESG
jgi:hypothetical protein